MKYNERLVGEGLIAVCAIALLGAMALGVKDADPGSETRAASSGQVRTWDEAHVLIAGWPEAARICAASMLEKHGVPDATAPGALIWRRRGPWLRMAAYRTTGPGLRDGLVEHSVRYEVSVAAWQFVDRIGLGVSYEPIGQVLSASSSSEESNILALNLAVDVFQGRRSVAEAREFYSRTLDLTVSGKSSPYTRGLLFKPAPLRRARQPGQLWPMP